MLKDKKEANKLLMRYAGLAMQFFVGIGLGVFLGIKLDNWVQISFPLFVWILPLLLMLGMILKIWVETNKK